MQQHRPPHYTNTAPAIVAESGVNASHEFGEFSPII
jgi:hypothetical protein